MGKKKESTNVEEALAAYRQALIDDDVERRISELAVAMGQWQQARENRRTTMEQLRRAEEAAEDVVVAAYNDARNAGAKVGTLEQINLKPTEAITAVNRRTGSERGRPGGAKGAAAAVKPDRVASARVPLTQPSEDGRGDGDTVAESEVSAGNMSAVGQSG